MLLLPTSGLHCVRLPLTFQGPLHGALELQLGPAAAPLQELGIQALIHPVA